MTEAESLSAEQPPVPEPLEELDPPTWIECLVCRAIFRDRLVPHNPSDAWADATGELNPEGIAEILRIAELELANEQSRSQQLDGKTASFAAFAGLLLTVNIAFARSVFDLHLGSVGNVVAPASLVGASVGLLAATALALSGVVMPKRYRTLAPAELQHFLGPEKQTTSRVEIQRSWLQSVAVLIAQNRPVNDCKAKMLKLVGALVIASLLGVTAAGITLGVHALQPSRRQHAAVKDEAKRPKPTGPRSKAGAQTSGSASPAGTATDGSH